MRKVMTSLYIEEPMRDRVSRLAIVSGLTRSEVLRIALGRGIPDMERDRAQEIQEFNRVAFRLDMKPLELAARMTADEIHYRAVRDATTYPGAPASAA